MKKLFLNGLFSFCGAALAVYLTSYLDQGNWSKRFTLEQNKVVLEKRVDLIDKITKLTNRAPAVIGLKGSLQAEKDLIYLHFSCEQKKTSDKEISCNDSNFSSLRIENLAKEIHELNVQISSVITLTSIYFGPKTKVILNKINQHDPWLMSINENKELIDAMSSELNWLET